MAFNCFYKIIGHYGSFRNLSKVPVHFKMFICNIRRNAAAIAYALRKSLVA
jgi:hypothetical protein